MRRSLAWLAALAALALALGLARISGAVFTDTRTNSQTLVAASDWPTPTPTTTPTPSPIPTGLKVLFRNRDPGAPKDRYITPAFQVLNEGTSPVDLSRVKLRYWFTNDKDQDPPGADSIMESKIDDAAWNSWPPGGKVFASIGSLSPARPGADSYLEIGFEGTLTATPPDNTTYDIEMRLDKYSLTTNVVFDEDGIPPGGGAPTAARDYSYDTYSAYPGLVWTKVTLYYDSTLVFGNEP